MDNKHAKPITDDPIYGMSRAWLGGALNTARRINRELQEKAEGLEAELEGLKAERNELAAHVEAQSREIEKLREKLTGWRERFQRETGTIHRFRTERDALAAHVERLCEPAFAYRDAGEPNNMLINVDYYNAALSTPQTSLSRLIRDKQAEALEQATNDLYDTLGLNREQIDFLAARAEQLHRQAAGGSV